MRAFGTFAIVCFLSALSLGQEIPRTMTKMVVHLEIPGVPAGSFVGEPRVMYRAGTRLCRIEESPDNEHKIHGLLVINEPDEWMVNLFPKTAQHFIDAGPTFNCRMPIFVSAEDIKSSGDVNKPLVELEFGREREFFTKKGATPEQGPTLEGIPTKAYIVQIADSQLFLYTNGIPERPVAVSRQRGDTLQIYWYNDYEEIPFDPKLFAKPAGVKIEDVKPALQPTQ